MPETLAALVLAYVIGSIPVAYLTARTTHRIDIREHGSGNVGASNVFQTTSKMLVVPVGVAQIAQGLVAVLIARAFGLGDGAQAACGIAAVVANDWNPWLGFSGGRGVGTSIGVLLALAPAALAVFIAVALAGVALRAIPQGVLLGLFAAPLGAIAFQQPASVVVTCAALAALALVKRLTANGLPPEETRSGVWVNRLLYDRDIRDRDAWVRREIHRRDAEGAKGR
jgi:glycerol-3-phosphate acyltransferase PlsY